MPDFELLELGDWWILEDATLEGLVLAGEYKGHYPSINLICQHFSITRRGYRKLYLAHFKNKTRNEEIKQVLTTMADKKDALVEDLLLFGARIMKLMEPQPDYLIVARGSSIQLRGCPHVPYLGKGPELYLNDDYKWYDICRFLLVDKPVSIAGK